MADTFRARNEERSKYVEVGPKLKITTGPRRIVKIRMFADHLDQGDLQSERKLAELYEQLGRVMVERDFLLRGSALWRESGDWRWSNGQARSRAAASASSWDWAARRLTTARLRSEPTRLS